MLRVKNLRVLKLYIHKIIFLNSTLTMLILVLYKELSSNLVPFTWPTVRYLSKIRHVLISFTQPDTIWLQASSNLLALNYSTVKKLVFNTSYERRSHELTGGQVLLFERLLWYSNRLRKRSAPLINMIFCLYQLFASLDSLLHRQTASFVNPVLIPTLHTS